jgi:hypothetical protein
MSGARDRTKSSRFGAVPKAEAAKTAAAAASKVKRRRSGNAETKAIEPRVKTRARRPVRVATSVESRRPRAAECADDADRVVPKKSALRIYARQRLQSSPAQPIATIAPGSAYALRVPVTVHQGTVSLASSFSWSDTSRPDSTNVETVAIEVLRDGKSVTKGARIVYEETFSVTNVTPYVAARSFAFVDRTARGRHTYTLRFTNSTLSTVSLVLRDINFTVTC